MEAVIIDVRNAGRAADPQLTITEARGANPGSALYTLLAPAIFRNGQQTFTAPSNSTLDPETAYFVEVENLNSEDSDAARFDIILTLNVLEDSGGLSGWDIYDFGRMSSSSSWGQSRIVQVRLSGLVKADETAPTLAATDGATVDGTSLVLTYNEALNGGSDPATSAYTVKVNGSAVSISSVDVDGMTVAITLATAVAPTDTVTVTYAAPTSNPVEDEAGNDAALLTDREVTNNSAPPVFMRATVDGTTLIIRYDEDLATTVLPATTAFTVTVAGTTVNVTGVSISDSIVTLTLASAAERGRVVTFSYAVPSSNALQDPAGNKAAALTNQPAANRTTPTGAIELVSNIWKSGPAVFVIGHGNGNNNVAAQRFTTGSHPLGYELYNLQVNIERSSNGADPLITIRDATTI